MLYFITLTSASVSGVKISPPFKRSAVISRQLERQYFKDIFYYKYLREDIKTTCQRLSGGLKCQGFKTES